MHPKTPIKYVYDDIYTIEVPDHTVSLPLREVPPTVTISPPQDPNSFKVVNSDGTNTPIEYVYEGSNIDSERAEADDTDS